MTSFSINLTDPAFTRQLSEQEAGNFSAPLFITGPLSCAEVVFWSARMQTWIALVRDSTSRTLPPHVREVSVEGLDVFARQALGV